MFLYLNKIVQKDMDEITSKEYIPYSKLKDKTVLITGANGMLAYYFTCALMHLNLIKGFNIKVIALVRNKEKAERNYKGFLNSKNFKLLIQDVCTPINVSEKIDYILHAAGSASPYAIKNDPIGIIFANIKGTENVLELAKRNNSSNVLFTSTREIYGEINDIEKICEEDMGIIDPMDSRSCYPESKRMAEQMCKSYYLQYGVPSNVVRIAHSYGPGMNIDNDGRVMSDFIHDVVNKKNIVLKSDGTARRAFCYINDAVSAMFLVMLNGKIGEAYNIANETEEIEIRELAQKIVDLYSQNNLNVVFEANCDSSGYCKYKRVGLCTDKIEKLGWKQVVLLEEGLRRTIMSF